MVISSTCFVASQVPESFGNGVEDEAVPGERGILGEPPDAESGRPPDSPGLGRFVAADDLEKRGLPRAVAADDTDAFARFDLQAGEIKKRVMAVGHRHTIERDERHPLRLRPKGEVPGELAREPLRAEQGHTADRNHAPAPVGKNVLGGNIHSNRRGASCRHSPDPLI